MLSGKMPFLYKTIEGVFYGSLSQFTMTYFLFFTCETEFYPTVSHYPQSPHCRGLRGQTLSSRFNSLLREINFLRSFPLSLLE